MKFSLINLSALLLVSSASAVPDAASSLQQRAAPPPYKLCKTQTCPGEQKCLTQGNGAPDVCMVDAKLKSGCKIDSACLYYARGVACHDEKCYKPAMGGKLDEKCNPFQTCSPGLICNGGTCKRERGSACVSTKECGLALPCLNGKCKLGDLNEKCQNHSDCEHGVVCSTKHKVCKSVVGRGHPCDEEVICGINKCYQGTCEARPFDTACKEEGANCPDRLICASGKCRYRLDTGAACQYSDQCEFGLCNSGICSVGDQNGSCNHDVDCPPGRVCGPSNRCCKSGDNGCW